MNKNIFLAALTRNKVSAFRGACFLILACCVTLGEERPLPLAPEADWAWECRLPDAAYGQFGIIPVKTILTNQSNRPASLRRFFVHAHYAITIKNANGRILPPTPEGKALLQPEMIRGRIDVLLKPGEAHRMWLDLRKYFHLPVGNYTLQIGFHITAEDPEGKRQGAVIDKISPAMKFEVVPNVP